MDDYLELVWWINGDQATELLCLRQIIADFPEELKRRPCEEHCEFTQRVPFGECSDDGYLVALDLWFAQNLARWQAIQNALPRPTLTSAFFRASREVLNTVLVGFLKQNLSGGLFAAMMVQELPKLSASGWWGSLIWPHRPANSG